MNWREIYTTTILDLNDENSSSISEELVIAFCELILTIFLLRTNVVKKKANILFLSSSIVPGLSYVPIVNIHTKLPDVSHIREARGPLGERLGRIGFTPLEAFEDRWSLHSTMTDFFTIGATLFGVRPAPQSDSNVEITYIPFIEVNTLDDEIPLPNEYRYPIEQFLSSLMLARLGHFERAKIVLQNARMELKDVQLRAVR